MTRKTTTTSHSSDASKTPRKPRGKAKASAQSASSPASEPAKAKKVSGLDAVAQVLKDANAPMNCKDLVQTMLDKGLWTTGGATPTATIYAAILREIKTKGSESRFKKTARGMFAFNA